MRGCAGSGRAGVRRVGACTGTRGGRGTNIKYRGEGAVCPRAPPPDITRTPGSPGVSGVQSASGVG